MSAVPIGTSPARGGRRAVVVSPLPALLLEVQGHGDIGDDELGFFLHAAAKAFAELMIQQFRRHKQLGSSDDRSEKLQGAADGRAPPFVFIVDLNISWLRVLQMPLTSCRI
jgi:hypothetical protein